VLLAHARAIEARVLRGALPPRDAIPLAASSCLALPMPRRPLRPWRCSITHADAPEPARSRRAAPHRVSTKGWGGTQPHQQRHDRASRRLRATVVARAPDTFARSLATSRHRDQASMMTLCTFVWAGAAEEVLVVGHFPTRNPIRLRLADGAFTAAVELAPGEYCYKVRGWGQGQACVTLLP
jgi:hypothetical protein